MRVNQKLQANLAEYLLGSLEGILFFPPFQTITSWLKCWYFWKQQTGSSLTDVNKSGVTSLIAILSQQVILLSSGQMENVIARLWTNSPVDVVLKTRPRQRFTEVSAQQPESSGSSTEVKWSGRRWGLAGCDWRRVTKNSRQPKKILRLPRCKLLQTYSTNASNALKLFHAISCINSWSQVVTRQWLTG